MCVVIGNVQDKIKEKEERRAQEREEYMKERELERGKEKERERERERERDRGKRPRYVWLSLPAFVSTPYNMWNCFYEGGKYNNLFKI